MLLPRYATLAALLTLSACAHKPTAAPCTPIPRPPCGEGYVALYFEPETETFARPFTGGFGWLAEVADRCDFTYTAITGLPDPANPGDAVPLAVKRAERVRDFLNAFSIPITAFEYGDAEQQAKPGISYHSQRSSGR